MANCPGVKSPSVVASTRVSEDLTVNINSTFPVGLLLEQLREQRQ